MFALLYCVVVTSVHVVAVPDAVVRHPSAVVLLVLPARNAAWVLVSHWSNGVAETLVARHPSVESVVVLLPSYWACVTAVQLPLSDPLTIVRNPSDSSTVVFVPSYKA